MTPFEKRVFNFFDPAIQEMYAEAEEAVLKKIETYDARHRAQDIP